MPEQTRTTVRDNTDEQRFEAFDEAGELLAISTYKRYQDRIVFLHTEVCEWWRSAPSSRSGSSGTPITRT
jgi:predicted GNAT family acetyltransferase